MKTPKISSLNDDQLATLAKEISAEMERRENAKIKIRKGDTFDVKKDTWVTVAVFAENANHRFMVDTAGRIIPGGKVKVVSTQDNRVLLQYLIEGKQRGDNLPDKVGFEMQKKEFFDAFMS